MNNAMLPHVKAGIDLRSDYERDLAQSIEARRITARLQLERSERLERVHADTARAITFAHDRGMTADEARALFEAHGIPVINIPTVEVDRE